MYIIIIYLYIQYPSTCSGPLHTNPVVTYTVYSIIFVYFIFFLCLIYTYDMQYNRHTRYEGYVKNVAALWVSLL